MPDNTACANFSPKAAPAFGADCKRCGRAYAEHAPITTTEPASPAYPESGDYRVGNYEVSAFVREGELVDVRPEPVVVVSGTLGRQLLQATPAEARALSTALRVAADQADADAGTDATADDTPTWLRKLDVGAVPQRLVLNTEAANVTPWGTLDTERGTPAGLQVLADAVRATQHRIAALYAGAPIDPPPIRGQANRETVGAEESGEERQVTGVGPAAAPDYLA